MTDRIEDEYWDEEEVEGEPRKPLPLIRVQGEGYVIREETGERIPFTFQGEG